MIEFLCPSGHRIRCSDDQAGRGAKCPRCGVKFRIPPPSEATVPDSAGSDSSISQPELTDSGIGQAGPGDHGQPSGDEPQIEFLCPNGHHLHGPASLQGRPGECPECGSKFRIPTYDDVPDEEGTELEISLGKADGHSEPAGAFPQIDVTAPASGRDSAAHPLAGLFSRLWADKSRRETIELHLANGETVLPDGFAESLSQQSHGVFTVKEGDGTQTLTVIAWGSIARVLVRGVKQLPKEMTN